MTVTYTKFSFSENLNITENQYSTFYVLVLGGGVNDRLLEDCQLNKSFPLFCRSITFLY